MNKLLAVFLFSILCLHVNAQTQNVNSLSETVTGENGIQFFTGTWEEALALAEKENKLIFLDIYATWCGQCKRLKAKTFTDPEVAAYFNTHFINLSLDGEGNGLKIAQEFHVNAYPALFFFDKTNKPVLVTEGFKKPAQMIEMGEMALKQANNPQ